jgi:1,4-dihydroxy-2-naphthoyl-CoA synthase
VLASRLAGRPSFGDGAGALRKRAGCAKEDTSQEIRRLPMKYEEYQHLLFEHRDDGILLVTINRPDVLNATNNRLHWELSRVWKDIDEDPETRVIVITGKGRAFSAGGDLEMIDRM